MMSFEELITFLKRKFKNDKFTRVIRPWDLLRFKYLNQLEIRIDSSYAIKEKKGIWTIKEIDERGRLLVDKEFNDEFEACKFFLELMQPEIDYNEKHLNPIQ